MGVQIGAKIVPNIGTFVNWFGLLGWFNWLIDCIGLEKH
jgi:hypothetical protein